MLTLNKVKKNKQIVNFINQTEKYLDALGYTDHGIRHLDIVSQRARNLAQKLKLSKREQELCAIAGYTHDMGNFMGRTQHHYWSAMLFSQVYMNKINPDDLSLIIQAIVSHDKNELKIVNNVSAILIIADKSDVDRSRVKKHMIPMIKKDIHDRVNYATTDSQLLINKSKKDIALKVTIDTKVAKPIEYFEIFNDRMTFCRLAANFLGYNFTLIINNFKLS